MAHSLRARLLAWIVLPLAGAVVVDGGISHRNASATASVVQDRLLIGSARIVAEELRFDDGAIQARIPPAALELFQASEVDRVFYRVTASDGTLVAGYPELQLQGLLPTADLQPETPRFVDAEVRGQPVRAVAYLQPVLTETGIQAVRVEIAQTLQGHTRLARGLWLHAMTQQVVILALVALLVLIGLRQGLRPLLRLRDAVLARQPGALGPLEVDAAPVELAPLVDAVNDYARRLEHHTSVQQAFLQNAAHQLRTPLTLLATQVSFAVRAADAAGREESLRAIRQTVQQSARLVNQLLALSAVEAHGPPRSGVEPTALDEVARRVIEDMAGRAEAKAIDLGFEMTGGPATVPAEPLTLREIVMNLVDNAIRYTPPRGVVTCRIASGDAAVTLVIEDDGPGIPPEQRERVFERFVRLRDDESDGCGLGLAIVREFGARVGAVVRLRTPASGRGLAVEVEFPRARLGA